MTASRRWLVVWLLVALAARLPGLGKGLASDEFGSVMIASQPVATIPATLVREDFHPPLYHLLLHGWMRLGASASEAWARLLSVAAGVVGCWLLWRLGRRLAGDLFGRLLLAAGALLPQHIWMSQYVRGYAVATCWLLVAIDQAVAIGRARAAARLSLNEEAPPRARARWRWGVLVAAELAALYTFYYAALVLLGLNLALLVWMGRQRRLGAWVVSQAAVAFGYWPWVTALASQWSARSHHPIIVEQVGVYLGSWHLGGMARVATGVLGFDELLLAGALGGEWSRGWLLVAGVAAVAALVVVAWRGWIGLRRVVAAPEERWLIAALVVVPLAGAVTLHEGWGVVMMARYFAPTAGIAAIGLVAAYLTLRSTVARRLVAVAACAVVLWRAGAIYAWREIDFKAAAAYLARAATDDALVASAERERFDYYCRTVPGRHLVLTAQTLEGAPGADDRSVWWLRQAKWQHRQINAAAEAWLARGGFVPVEERRFGLLAAIRYERG